MNIYTELIWANYINEYKRNYFDKDYINLLHAIVSDIHFWNNHDFVKKREIVSKFLENSDFISDGISSQSENQHLLYFA